MSTETKPVPETVRGGTRDLILALADTKRVLGYRYAQWMLGAPELETGIALSSMAQDEWGHARLLYALLKEFGDDVDGLEHGREAAEYRSMEALDTPVAEWPGLVALMVLVDPAVSVQFEALKGSSHDPLRQRMEKMLDEERFHAAHGTAWARRLANGTDASRAALTEALERTMPPVLRWFGPDSERARQLVEAGVADAAGSTLRARFVDRVTPVLDLAGLEGAHADAEPDLEGFDEARRRGAGSPDEDTIERIRGDRNRAFLLD